MFIFIDSMGKKNFKKKLGVLFGKNKREIIYLLIMKIFLLVLDNFKVLNMWVKWLCYVNNLCILWNYLFFYIYVYLFGRFWFDVNLNGLICL